MHIVHVLWNCSLSSMSCLLSRQMHATCDKPLQSARHAWTKLRWHALHHAGPTLIIHCARYLYNARECNECCRGHRYQWTVPWCHAVCLNVSTKRLRQLSGSEWVPDLNWPEHIQTHTQIYTDRYTHTYKLLDCVIFAVIRELWKIRQNWCENKTVFFWCIDRRILTSWWHIHKQHRNKHEQRKWRYNTLISSW